MNEQAVAKIFQTKGRPQDNPLIVHLAHPDQLSQYARVNHTLEQTLIQKLTPGPLTILLENISIPHIVTAGQTSVGIRFPDHPLALDLLGSFD
jgi:L-threonylcarbamoyladenylate synthase